ncbi:neuron derived neurotrophic factor nord isoform X2 [Megachile rotundata]|uniref:neuron derived neurotrophic factor nord isoform X2 n=1 Tax=Megachile rotundata TaxID=143995 RepID=UPI003FD441AE
MGRFGRTVGDEAGLSSKDEAGQGRVPSRRWGKHEVASVEGLFRFVSAWFPKRQPRSPTGIVYSRTRSPLDDGRRGVVVVVGLFHNRGKSVVTMRCDLPVVALMLAFVSVPKVDGCAFCDRLSQQQMQLRQLQQLSQQQQQQQGYKTMGSPRPFGAEKPTRAQEFNRTGVLHPEYQIPATLRPGNVSQFYYLSPREGPPLTLLVSPCSGPISWTVSYVEPPENSEETEGTNSQSRWPVKSLKPGSPLFTYKGAEDQNFTISKTRAGLYWFEIKSIDPPDANLQKLTPSTVLLYATSSELRHIPELYANERENRHHSLRFQQRRSKRRLTISWNKSNIDPHLSHYCLAVTSGSQAHPLTLCAAQNVLRVHPHPTKGSSSKEQQHRGIPEGLHCVRQTKLTLHRMKYDTTYNFTLYVIPSRSAPHEYRSLRTCHEVTVGVESAGAAKYCILVRELKSASSLSSITTIPDQCGLHRRRRSEYTFEVCEEKQSPPKDRALPFTLKRLQPGKTYLLQITAQLKGQSLSYPLLVVRTRRSCLP